MAVPVTTFLTDQRLVHYRELYIQNYSIMANLVNKKVQSEFGQVGDTVKVSKPATAEVKRFTGTATSAGVAETSQDVIIDEHLYVQKEFDVRSLTLDIQDWFEQVEVPILDALVGGIDEYILYKLAARGLANNIGTIGTDPSVFSDVVAAQKKLKDLHNKNVNAYGVINTTTEASFSQLDVFKSVDYGPDSPLALRNYTLGRRANIDYFSSPFANDFTFANFKSSGLTANTTSGSTSITILGLDAPSAGTKNLIKAGTRFTVVGVTGIKRVVTQVEYEGTSATVVVDTAADATVSGADVARQAAHKQNIVFEPTGTFFAGIAPKNDPQAQIISLPGGINIAVSFHGVEKSTLSSAWTWHVLMGCDADEKFVVNFHGAA